MDPGGGTIFADAARGSAAFDKALRRFVAALLPGKPAREGVTRGGRWAVIDSKYDLGGALGHREPLQCKRFTHESAVRIATNIVVDSTLR